MGISEFLLAAGVPTAITGLLVWYLKRHIDKRDARQEEREKNIEKLMLMIMQDGRATNVLTVATAKAVQRIPDAHCNGDMTEALRQAAEIQQEEKEFLMNLGIKHIFEE
jgi:hypothetical protein